MKKNQVERRRALQGRYMGRLNGVDEKKRARAKAIAAKNGVAAAVRFLEG